MQTAKEFGLAFYNRRVWLGYTEEEMAEKAGITVEDLRQLENGENEWVQEFLLASQELGLVVSLSAHETENQQALPFSLRLDESAESQSVEDLP